MLKIIYKKYDTIILSNEKRFELLLDTNEKERTFALNYHIIDVKELNDTIPNIQGKNLIITSGSLPSYGIEHLGHTMIHTNNWDGLHYPCVIRVTQSSSKGGNKSKRTTNKKMIKLSKKNI